MSVAPRATPPRLEAMPPGAWRARVPVRFSHCDPAGIVYFARYFDMLNGVVEDWFTEGLGIPYHATIRDRRTGLGYVRAEADFLAPSSMGETLVFLPVVERLGRSSLPFRVHAFREDGAPALLMNLVIVTTSLDTHRPIPIPSDLRTALESYTERCR